MNTFEKHQSIVHVPSTIANERRRSLINRVQDLFESDSHIISFINRTFVFKATPDKLAHRRFAPMMISKLTTIEGWPLNQNEMLLFESV